MRREVCESKLRAPAQDFCFTDSRAPSENPSADVEPQVPLSANSLRLCGEKTAGRNLAKSVHVALATPPGTAGIAEIHLWGEGALVLADSIFRSKSRASIAQTPPERFRYGHIVKDGQIIDEVIVRRKEHGRICSAQSVEIGCHGGGVPASTVIDLLVDAGAVLTDSDAMLKAAAGEGRISRIEADAHRMLRACVSEEALHVLLAELEKHSLEKELVRIYRLIAQRDAACVQELRKLLEHSWAVPYADPRPVFITGFPNVGKSSLFNAISGRERVIVHDTPGTTRDVIEELLVADDVPFRLHDCAGVGESRTELEKQAQAFALRAIEAATLILMVFDGSRPVKEAQMELYYHLDCEKLLPIINKTDLERARMPADLRPCVEVSALTGAGVKELCAKLTRRLTQRPQAPGPSAFTARQEGSLQTALAALEAGNVTAGLEAIAEVIGRVPDLNAQFNRRGRRERRGIEQEKTEKG